MGFFVDDFPAWYWPTEADKEAISAAHGVTHVAWPLWHARYERFRLAGPARSILGTWKAERAERGKKGQPTRQPGSWDKYIAAWPARARLWDEHNQRAEAAAAQEAIEAEREQARKNRQRLLDAGQNILTRALLLLNSELGADMVPADYDLKAARILSAIERYQKMSLLVWGEPSERIDVHVSDWRSDAISMIKAGRLTFEATQEVYGIDLAVELFRQAGVNVTPGPYGGQAPPGAGD